MNNSQKTSWLTDWKSDRTKFVLYLFPLGGVNGITGPIKFWCRGKRHFLCVLPHRGSSIHVCVHVSLCVVKQGQDSISVFGHGAGPVAQGVFWLELWPSSGKEPSVPESHPLNKCSLYLFLCPVVPMKITWWMESLARSSKHLSSSSFSKNLQKFLVFLGVCVHW